MVRRHEREIAPLLKRRRLFAESGNFLLYDFFTDAGKVDENVFAYSNRSGNERALVVFNNRYGETHGTIDYSTAYADKGANQLRQQRIGEGLGFGGHSGAVLAWRDSLTGLEYLHRASDLYRGGLTLALHAYQCHVFVDWCELYSTQDKPWDRLSDQLNGRGVPSLEDALVNLELQPVHDALRTLLDPGMVRLFADLAEHPRTVAVGVNTEIEVERAAFFSEVWMRCERFMRVAQKACLTPNGGAGTLAGIQPANPGLLGAAFRSRLRAAMRVPAVEALFPSPWPAAARRVLPSPSPQLTATALWGPVLAWRVLELLAESFDAEKQEPVALELFDRLRLREPLAQVFAALGLESEEAWRAAARVKVGLLTGAGDAKPKVAARAESTGLSPCIPRPESGRALAPEGALPESKPECDKEQAALAPALWPALWLDPDVRWLTGVHEAEGRDYLVREPFEELLWWLLMPRLLRLANETGADGAARNHAAAEAMSRSIEAALAAVEAAGYRVDRVMAPGGIEDANEASTLDTAPAAKAEIGAEAEAATEPGSEAPVEAADEHELAAEVETATAEQAKPVEPVRESVAESITGIGAEGDAELAAVEAVAELDSSAENESPAVAGETQPCEPDSETALDATPEAEVDAAAEPSPAAAVESVAELDSSAENESPVAAEEPQTGEPDSATAIEAAPEVAVEAVAEPAAEAVAKVEIEAEPLPEAAAALIEESQPSEPESETALEATPETEVEAAAELAAESVVEVEIEAEPSTDAELAMIEDSAPDVPEVKAAAQVAVEAYSELASGDSAEAEPEPKSQEEAKSESSATAEPAAAGELKPVEPEDKPKVGLLVESVEEPIAGTEVKPPFAVRWEPPPPKIDFAAKPVTEAQTAAQAVHLLTERWEPSPPRIEFVAKSPAEAKTEGEELPPHAKPRETLAAKNNYGADALAEPRSLAELLLSLNERWEPPAPKIEFAARPATEVKSEEVERVSHDELPEQEEPQSESPE
jgi:hypothetical protein